MNLLTLRDKAWDYPYYLLVGRNSVAGQARQLYLESRPFSHMAVTLIVTLLITSLMMTQLETILGFNQNTFVEGVIVGTTPAGDPQEPSKLNPLQIVTTQLDKDIIELIYEPLIKVDEKGQIVPVLAENYTQETTKTGKSYRFSLRKDVYWHDGKQFTTKDVEATFGLIKELGGGGVPNVYSGTSTQSIELDVLDDHIVRFTLNDGILPNFFEAISFKIVPAHLIEQYKDAFIRLTDSEKLISVGTGPFVLNDIVTGEVQMVANEKYYRGQPKIEKFNFKLLRDAEEAVSAIKSGQVHALANLNNDIISEVSDNNNVSVRYSPPIYTQYWGLYFNLTDSGSKLLQDSDIRKVFSYGINRELAIKSALDKAEAAYGPIPEISAYYDKNSQQPKYDREKALELLKKEGWKLVEIEDKSLGKKYKVQSKGESKLDFEIAYVDNPDRVALVDSIRADLAAIGIVIRPKALQPQQLVNARLTQDFDMLLFGVSTFVDPDRYELFHSSQTVAKNGLNISGYSSSQTTTIIDTEKRKAVRLPLSDRLLDDGRKSDDFSARKEDYVQFQKLLQTDIPVIFMYHPTVRYLVSNRIKNVELVDVRSVEDRFRNVHEWEISYN